MLNTIIMNYIIMQILKVFSWFLKRNKCLGAWRSILVLIVRYNFCCHYCKKRSHCYYIYLSFRLLISPATSLTLLIFSQQLHKFNTFLLLLLPFLSYHRYSSSFFYHKVQSHFSLTQYTALLQQTRRLGQVPLLHLWLDSSKCCFLFISHWIETRWSSPLSSFFCSSPWP